MTQGTSPQTIKKPGANPMVALLLSLILLLGHVVVNGQTRKWVYILIAYLIGYVLCCLPGLVIAILGIVDAYQTAVRLKAGEEIGINEYSNATLFKIVKIIDKQATFKGK